MPVARPRGDARDVGVCADIELVCHATLIMAKRPGPASPDRLPCYMRARYRCSSAVVDELKPDTGAPSLLRAARWDAGGKMGRGWLPRQPPKSAYRDRDS